MFNIGTWELVVILILALVLVGPYQLPRVAKSVGKTLARLRHSLEEAKREIGLEELKREIEEETLEDEQLQQLQSLLDLRAQVRQALDVLPEHSDSQNSSAPIDSGLNPPVG